MNKKLLKSRIKQELRNVLDVKIYKDDSHTTIMIIQDLTSNDMVTMYNFVDDYLVRVNGNIYISDLKKVMSIFKELYDESLS